MKTLSQKQLEEGLTDQEKQRIFLEESHTKELITQGLEKKPEHRNYSELIDAIAADLLPRLKNSSSLGPEFINDALRNGKTLALIAEFVGYRHAELREEEAKKGKPFTVQTAEKTDPDIRILRANNYGRQSIPEIVKNLEAIATSNCINQPAHREASLWNAIDILEDTDQKERNIK